MAKKKKNKRNNTILIVFLIIFIVTFCISGFFVVRKLLEYKQGQTLYDDIRVSVIHETNDPEKPPIEIDWDTLLEMNSDVVAWLYMEGTDISYPVMQTEDNEFYLHRDFNKNYLYAGSLFLDRDNSPDFSDTNSIIYGHNMMDGSMFGRLIGVVNSNSLEGQSPFFWILTPEADYKYIIFSGFETTTQSEVYKILPRGDADFVNWCYRMQQSSTITMPEAFFKKSSKIVTLSTCGMLLGESRVVVLGDQMLTIEHNDNKSSDTGNESATDSETEETSSDSDIKAMAKQILLQEYTGDKSGMYKIALAYLETTDDPEFLSIIHDYALGVIMGEYGDSEERRENLGDLFGPVQGYIDEHYEELINE